MNSGLTGVRVRVGVGVRVRVGDAVRAVFVAASLTVNCQSLTVAASLTV